MSHKKPTGKPVGRPSYQSLGIEKRKRRNLNIERTEDFDNDLLNVRKLLAFKEGVNFEQINQTKAMRYAVNSLAQWFTNQPSNNQQCPHCNGLGIIAIRNGDDSVDCPDCSEEMDTPI